MELKVLFNFILLQVLFTLSTSAQEAQLLDLLPTTINESSGLLHFNGRLLTHLDSGGEPALYEIDSLSGSILRTVYIGNVTNIDWEDISQDDDYIYIGDFGNNTGARVDLKVYRILKSDYLMSNNDTVYADTISFSYANQTDFTAGSNNTNFDAEAMIAHEDSLYIFSKNWLTNTCDIYALSKLPGTYLISKIDSFDSQGLITGASFHPATNRVYLCGYGPPVPFVTVIYGFNGFPLQPSNLNKVNIQVPTGSSVQIEGIAQTLNHGLYLSAETSVLGAASLMIMEHIESFAGINNHQIESLSLYPNPSTQYLQFDKKPAHKAILFNKLGQVLLETYESRLNTSQLNSGQYFILIKDNNGVSHSRNSFIINH